MFLLQQCKVGEVLSVGKGPHKDSKVPPSGRSRGPPATKDVFSRTLSEGRGFGSPAGRTRRVQAQSLDRTSERGCGDSVFSSSLWFCSRRVAEIRAWAAWRWDFASRLRD